MLLEFRPNPCLALVASAALLLCGAPFTAQAQQPSTIQPKPTTQDGGRYSRAEEGWFWYQAEPEPVEPTPELPPEPTAQESKADQAKPIPFSAEWIAQQLEETRIVAIDDPTKDNMERYLLLQKLAMDKSEQFALAHRQYATLNPGIDETIQNPVGGTSRMSMTRAQEEGMTEVVKQIGNDVGIWYFFSSECQFCHQQNPVVNILTESMNMSVLPISLDARSSADGALPNWRPDRGQAEMLGVLGTPTMYLVHPETNRVLLLSSGVRTLPDLQRRIVEIAKAEEWISQNDYDRAMRGLPRRFITDGLDLEGEIEDDPDLILAMLREAAMHGQVQESQIDEIDSSTMTPWAPRPQDQ